MKPFTRRERQYVSLRASGKSIRETALAMGLTYPSAKVLSSRMATTRNLHPSELLRLYIAEEYRDRLRAYGVRLVRILAIHRVPDPALSEIAAVVSDLTREVLDA